jgi:cardiolipin synthase A/B
MQWFVSNLFTILATSLALYALVVSVFLVTENRRPQSTLAWMLVLFFAPGIGLVVYLLFGRDNKAFSNRRKLLMQVSRQMLVPCYRLSCPARMPN